MNIKQLNRSFKCFPICAILLLGLAGCASQVPQLGKDLEGRASCCASLAELRFAPMPGHQEITFDIGPSDPVYQFPSGKSFTKAFELPVGRRTDRLEVRTHLVGSYIPTAHVFGPYMQFLDAMKAPIGADLFPALYFDKGFLDGPRWNAVVKIPEGARYVVMFTKPELIKFRRMPMAGTAGGAYMAGNAVVYVPPSGERSVAYAPGGKLRIRLLSDTD